MYVEILTKVIERIMADTWFQDMGGASTGKPVTVESAHARKTTDTPEPYILLDLQDNPTDLAHDLINIEISVFDSRSNTNRWAIAARLRKALQNRNFYSDGVNLLRLCPGPTRDGLPDRTTGRVKLVSLYRGTAVSKL